MSVMRVFVLCAEFAHAHVQIKTHGAKAECRVEERTDFSHPKRSRFNVFSLGVFIFCSWKEQRFL